MLLPLETTDGLKEFAPMQYYFMLDYKTFEKETF